MTVGKCLRMTVWFKSGERLETWMRDMDESTFVKQMLEGVLKEKPPWVNLDRLPEGKGLEIVNLGLVNHIEVREVAVEDAIAWARGAGLLPPKDDETI